MYLCSYLVQPSSLKSNPSVCNKNTGAKHCFLNLILFRDAETRQRNMNPIQRYNNHNVDLNNGDTTGNQSTASIVGNCCHSSLSRI